MSRCCGSWRYAIAIMLLCQRSRALGAPVPIPNPQLDALRDQADERRAVEADLRRRC